VAFHAITEVFGLDKREELVRSERALQAAIDLGMPEYRAFKDYLTYEVARKV
jgi:hypothetical protein